MGLSLGKYHFLPFQWTVTTKQAKLNGGKWKYFARIGLMPVSLRDWIITYFNGGWICWGCDSHSDVAAPLLYCWWPTQPVSGAPEASEPPEEGQDIWRGGHREAGSRETVQYGQPQSGGGDEDLQYTGPTHSIQGLLSHPRKHVHQYQSLTNV